MAENRCTDTTCLLLRDQQRGLSWRSCCVLQVAEVVGGIYAHSLAILTDAAHMLSDVSSFVVVLAAGTYALRRSQPSHTFGYHRAEILGSMVS